MFTRAIGVFLQFLRLGLTAFGGPVAHISMMEDIFVRRLKWLESRELLDLLGVTHLVPGPNSTELALHVGYKRAGYPGLFAAGIGFILPAAAITTVLGLIYRSSGQLPEAGPFLRLVPAVMLAVVATAGVRLLRTACTSIGTLIIAVATAVTTLLTGQAVISFLVCALVGALWNCYREGLLTSLTRKVSTSFALLMPFWLAAYVPRPPAHGSADLGDLALVFLKAGALLYGSGYVLVAFLEHDLVHGLQVLRSWHLLDAVAAGQLTPGPVLTTSTFIGAFLHGWKGAAVCTLSMFAPAFIITCIIAPFALRIRQVPIGAATLTAVNAAAAGLLAEACLALAKSFPIGPTELIASLLAFVLLLRGKISLPLLVILSVVAGYLSAFYN